MVYGRRITLDAKHIAILLTVGAEGARIDDLGRSSLSREFDQLITGGLLVFWPPESPRPMGIVGSARGPGTWCLTPEGAAAVGLELPPLRLSNPS